MVVNKTDKTRRLAKNTLYLYFRSIFCLLLSLYSSRLILHALGVDDYGINNAVAGFASMFALVTGSFSSAISRFLTFEQGTGNKEKQRDVFALSLNMMIAFSLIILILAETLGIWFVGHKMTIPEGRETAAIWTFRFAVLTVMSGLIVSPFNSAIIAHEKMGIYAVINIIEAILRLGLALFLTYGHYTADRLILFAGIWAVCTIGLQAFAIAYSSYHFQECRLRLFFDKDLFKDMFGYAGWSFVGSVSGTLSGQGVNTLINIYCGPAINAARGLSNTVHQAIAMFVNNFTIALTPQITKAYAAEDKDYTKYLAYRGVRFSFFIMFLIALPVLLEAEFVFTLWLGDVPDHTVNFNRLTLINSLVGLSYASFGTVQHATGNIRNYSLIMSLIILLQFPSSWILLRLGCAPEYVYVSSIGVAVLGFIAATQIVKKTLDFTYAELLKEIYFPEFKVIICSTIIPLIAVLLLPYGWWRFLITGTLCVLCTVPSILFLGCSKGERAFIFNVVKNKMPFLFPGK